MSTPAPSTTTTTTTAASTIHPSLPSLPPTSDPDPAPMPQPLQPAPPEPQTQLTLLLLSGNRKTFSFPPETTVGRVKELVWGSWPNEWRDEQLPPSPSYFRLLHLGRMLQDDSTLASNNLTPQTTPQIVHLSIKAFVPASTDSKPKKRKSPSSHGHGAHGHGLGAEEAPGEGEVEGGCCAGCVVM